MRRLFTSGPRAKTSLARPHLKPAVIALAFAAAAPTAAQPVAGPTDADAVAQGRYLATLGGCGDCHTSKDGPYAGGRPLKSGLGTVVSANITPDPETGIGSWSADDFYRAMHEGKSRKVGHLFPAFPYPHFTKVTRADADALFAFLQSQAPVHNDPKRNQLSFPLNIRGFMAIWNGLYLHKGQFKPDPARPADWNRGAYIVEALAHCGACHTPKDSLQAEVASRAFQGGAVEGWFAPNLTPEPRTGLGGWASQDLVDFLKTGRNRFTAGGGLMAGVIMGSTSKMEDADLQAIAAYLLSLPPSPSPPARIDAEAVARGGAIFTAQCSACHGEGARTAPGRFPPLEGDALVQAPDATTVVRYVLEGRKTPITAAHPRADQMPGFAAKLDDQQVADVVSFVRGAWSNRATSVSPREVTKLRAMVQAAGSE